MISDRVGYLEHFRTLPLVHTGRLVGLMRAQISHYNLLRCTIYKKIVLKRRYYRGDRRANYRRANCLKYCKQTLFEIFAQFSRYKKLVLFWRNMTRLANAPTPEQIIMTYLRSHQTYQSACVNTLLPLDQTHYHSL